LPVIASPQHTQPRGYYFSINKWSTAVRMIWRVRTIADLLVPFEALFESHTAAARGLFKSFLLTRY